MRIERSKIYLGDFCLENGESLPNAFLSYEGYGNRDNPVILLFHAKTGSAHAAGILEVNEAISEYWTKELCTGWGNHLIGSGKLFDTDAFYVICIHYLNGCYGFTGANSIDPKTEKPYGIHYPHVSLNDIVRSQHAALEALEINHLHAVAGASFGGMLAFNYAMIYPNEVDKVIQIASGFSPGEKFCRSLKYGCTLLDANPEFYCWNQSEPASDALTKSLILARANTLPFYTTDARIKRTTIKSIKSKPDISFVPQSIEESFYIEAARSFPKRFCPYTFYNISKLMAESDLETVFKTYSKYMTRQQHCIVSFIDDRCFPPERQTTLHHALLANDICSEHLSIRSNHEGHDAFLVPDCTHFFRDFIKSFISA